MWRKFVFNSPGMVARRKQLRNNPTEAEQLLWDRLKNSKIGIKFIDNIVWKVTYWIFIVRQSDWELKSMGVKPISCQFKRSFQKARYFDFVLQKAERE